MPTLQMLLLFPMRQNFIVSEIRIKQAGVASMRKILSTKLFAIGAESGIKYVEDLRRQLRVTEEWVNLRQEKEYWMSEDMIAEAG